MTRRCTCCGEPFEPRPQVPNQAFCSLPDCQRARKRQWQRAKLRIDADYRVNQRSAQQAWTRRNPDYWRGYRNAHSGYEQHNRTQPPSRDARTRAGADLAKMDVCDLPAGLYRITPHPVISVENRASRIFEITPVCAMRPRKMDV